MNKNIWNNFKNSLRRKISRKDLNKEENKEYTVIKCLAQQLIMDNFNRKPIHSYTRKSVYNYGYYISLFCNLNYKRTCNWTVIINLRTNQATLTCDRLCEHENQTKNKII